MRIERLIGFVAAVLLGLAGLGQPVLAEVVAPELEYCLVAPSPLPAFSRTSIDDAVTSVSRAHNDQISVGARAIDKRLGANSAPFQGIEATTANARALVTDILENPTRTVFGQRTYDVYNAAGQGARFDVSSNRFITFLDETIATR